jgi:hypothetical protein
MTEADLLRCIEAVDRRRELCRSEHGRFKAVPPIAGTGGRSASAKATAKIVGTSQAKIFTGPIGVWEGGWGVIR